jgi:hypothetical protein
MMPSNASHDYTYKRDFSDGSYVIYKRDVRGNLHPVTTASSDEEANEIIHFLSNSSSSSKKKDPNIIDDEYRAMWKNIIGTDLP